MSLFPTTEELFEGLKRENAYLKTQNELYIEMLKNIKLKHEHQDSLLSEAMNKLKDLFKMENLLYKIIEEYNFTSKNKISLDISYLIKKTEIEQFLEKYKEQEK
jgi:hypothetical protein